MDLAAEAGGNVETTVKDEVFVTENVSSPPLPSPGEGLVILYPGRSLPLDGPRVHVSAHKQTFLVCIPRDDPLKLPPFLPAKLHIFARLVGCLLHILHSRRFSLPSWLQVHRPLTLD